MLRVALVIACTLFSGFVHAEGRAALAAATRAAAAADEAFLAAREAATVGNRERFEALAARLRDHPLAVYVELWRLQMRLRADPRAVPDADVLAFLERHAGEYVADRLRLDWLLALAARRDYAAFERELPRLVWGDDAQLRCYAALVRYQRNEGRRIEELAAEARRVLLTSREPGGDGCWALTEALLVDDRLSPWARMRALVESNQPAVARRLVAWLPGVNAGSVALAIDRPAEWLASREKRLAAERELAHVAIARLAREDPAQAARWALRLEPHQTAAARAQRWGRIGHMAAYRLMPEALAWYKRGGGLVGVAPETARADEVLEWMVRAALRGDAQGADWETVRETIERMPADLRREPSWSYWHARALQAGGRAAEAAAAFAELARRLDFYGRLAAEELTTPPALPPAPSPPSEEEVETWRGNAGFARALKFYALGLRAEGNREWN
ncbi:MAG: lytic transglycosylase domain-containing protein, partial [Burkholderiaceae bacterium]|nr:lytic transglycosylase domain-containing protein [Burkholderiaceae bacterium]